LVIERHSNPDPAVVFVGAQASQIVLDLLVGDVEAGPEVGEVCERADTLFNITCFGDRLSSAQTPGAILDFYPTVGGYSLFGDLFKSANNL
jgi:hypothetical protein